MRRPLERGRFAGPATSSDGVVWVMDPANPVMNLGDPGQWDDGTLWVGAVIHDGSGFRMWYQGPGYSVRLATSECCATVFFDGFESGDTSAWSATVP